VPPSRAHLNPIEQLFSKLKTLLRNGDPRISKDTWCHLNAISTPCTWSFT